MEMGLGVVVWVEARQRRLGGEARSDSACPRVALQEPLHHSQRDTGRKSIDADERQVCDMQRGSGKRFAPLALPPRSTTNSPFPEGSTVQPTALPDKLPCSELNLTMKVGGQLLNRLQSR